MKITMLGPFPPFRGGIQHFNTRLYRELVPDHTIQIINFKRQYPALLFPGKTQFEEGYVPVPEYEDRVITPLNPYSWLRTTNKIRAFSPDLLLFKYWMPFFAPAFGTIAKLVRKKSATKVVCLIDNLVPHESHIGDRTLNRYLIRNTDAFLPMSGIVRDQLLELNPDVLYRMNPHPVYDNFGDRIPRHEARTRLGLDERPLILYFGLIRQYKGLSVLIDALPEVLRAVDCQTIIAGEFYDDKRPYDEQIRRNGLEGRIRVDDQFIKNEEVAAYFCAADVVVLPYLSATQSGIVSIAMIFGVPVIVTNVGGLPEVVKDGKTGLLVPPNDPAALARAIIEYFQTIDREAMVAAVEQERQRYSWSSLTDALFQLVKEIPER